MITWKKGQYSTEGYIGQVRFFSYAWDTARPKGVQSSTPYLLMSTLPQSKKYHFATPAECEAKAVQVALTFAKLLAQADHA